MRGRRRAGAWLVLLGLVLLGSALLTGCTRTKGPVDPRASARGGSAAPDPATRAQMLINAGNQAFHAGDYSLAARRYAAAAVVRKDDPVAYFGLGMALTRLGRDEDARAAYAKARELTQQRRP